VSRRPLGFAIVGGIVFSTLLTLYLVPAVWVTFEGLRSRVRRRGVATVPLAAAEEAL
jgi:HAE1 family hydrophobic/amphiphilic exporter-1